MTATLPTFVFIPGAGGRAWYWHRVVAELETRSLEAIAVDLPAADDSAGLVAYSQVVIEAVGDIRPLVLVAQSMGGFTAPMVCDQIPVDLLVLVNAMIPLPGETGAEWWANTHQEQAATEYAREQGRNTEFDPIEDFFHDVPPNVREEAFRLGEPVQSGTPFEQPWPLSSWPTVPTRIIAGRDDRLFPATFQERIARERLGLTVGVLPGGHLIALSNPTDLVDALIRYSDP